MDAENFRKLTAILDVLDRYKKSLAVASFQASPEKSFAKYASRAPSLRGGKGSTWMPPSVLSDSFGTIEHDVSRPASENWPVATAAAIQRKLTIRRAKTLQIRRQATVRASCPELPQIQGLQVDVDASCGSRSRDLPAHTARGPRPGWLHMSAELATPLREKVRSRGMVRCFSGPLHSERSLQESLKASTSRRWASRSEGDVTEEAVDSDDDESLRPDIVFTDSVASLDVKSLSELDFDDVDLEQITPKMLGQLFDRIMECLQVDFKDLIDKVKAQNGHLKQDIISMKKKLQDAVDTNDDQVQELKDMTERVADLQAEVRELKRQLSLLEAQLQKYAEQDREMQALMHEKAAWEAERHKLTVRVQKLTQELGTRDDGQRLWQLLRDFDCLEALNQEKEERLKTLAKHLEAKEREIESLNLNLSMQQNTPTTPRREPRSSLVSPRVSFEYYSSSLGRRSTVARRHIADTMALGPVAPAPSLAGELREAIQEEEEKPGSRVEAYVKQLEEVQRKLDNALADLEEASRTNDQLRNDVRCLQMELEEKSKVVEELTEEVKDKDQRLSSAVEKLKDRNVSLEEIRRKLSEAEEGRSSKDTELESLREELAAVRAELDALNKQGLDGRELTESLKGQVAGHVEQLERLGAELAEARQKLDKGRDANKVLSAELESLKKQLEDAAAQQDVSEATRRARLDELEAELEAARGKASRIAELEGQLKDLEEERELLRRTGAEMEETLKTEIEILRAHIVDQEQTFARTRQELWEQCEAAEQEKADLESRLVRLDEDLRRLREAERRAEALKPEPDTLAAAEAASEEDAQKVRALLEQHQTELRLLQDEIAQLSRTKEDLEKEKVGLDARVSGLTQELKEVQTLYEEMQNKLKSALREKEEERERLVAVCAAMEKSVDSKIEQARNALLEENKEERKERERLAHAVNCLQEQVDKLKSDNSALQAALEAAEKDASRQPPELLAQSQALQDANAQLTKEVAALQAKFNAVQATLQGENAQLKENLRQERAAFEALQSAEDDLLRQLEDLKERNADLEVLVKATEGEGEIDAERLQQACRRLTAQVAQLEKDMESKERQMDQEKDTLLQRCILLEEGHRELETLVTQLRQEKESLQSKLQSASDKLLFSEQDAEEWQKKHHLSVMENENLKSKLALLTEQQGRLMEGAAEQQKLSSLMEHVVQELLQLRGQMTEFKELGTKIQDKPSTTVFNVGYPENVIPMVNVHGDPASSQSVNISGMYDLRMSAGQYATFSAGGRSRAATPARKSRAAVLLESLKEGLYSSSCCVNQADSRAVSTYGNGGTTYVFPAAVRQAPTAYTTPTGANSPKGKGSRASSVLRIQTRADDLSVEQFFAQPTESDTRPAIHPLLPPGLASPPA
ncbi:putative myosin heavy chain [Besnoitia besnoiti]|uniref:Putative myosin heavy chain n=1 Tax=Besnoitia besnoiti TaxID=94643 RepID=A0A2A9MEE5_BESBE|nr:putative myosin heavy chain [Besnoitia besnoiti]PFH34043.1 putative myosin heavy chain [Besnoitia besnoiti]